MPKRCPPPKKKKKKKKKVKTRKAQTKRNLLTHL